MSTLPSLNEIQEYFFTTMLEGWASNAPKVTMPDMPGYKAIRAEKGLWQLQDWWCVRAGSNVSAGTTTIWYDHEPVWMMQYGGSYPKEVMKLVKSCVRAAYTERTFYGGRGILEFEDTENEYLYINTPSQNDFADFRGREEVLRLSDKTLIGYHDYRGMALR